MIRQLQFDFMLLKEKKMNVAFILGGDLIYVIMRCILFQQEPFYSMVLTMILATIHIYIVSQTLNTHNNNLNQGISNYGSCIYFPTKRGYYFASRVFYSLATLVHLLVIIMIMNCLSSLIYHCPFAFSQVTPHFLYALVTILWFSGIMMVTSFSGRAASSGRILGFTILAMFAGGISAAVTDHGAAGMELIPLNLYIIIVFIAIIYWLFMTLLALWISKKVTV